MPKANRGGVLFCAKQEIAQLKDLLTAENPPSWNKATKIRNRIDHLESFVTNTLTKKKSQHTYSNNFIKVIGTINQPPSKINIPVQRVMCPAHCEGPFNTMFCKYTCHQAREA